MRTLILGANGIVGSSIKEFFLNEYSRNTKNTLICPDSRSLNLTKATKVKSYFEKNDKFDNIIFLVAMAHSKGKNKDVDEFRRLNFNTLKNTLDALDYLKKLPQKFIFTSTISVYGEKYFQKLYNEETTKTPFSPYATTKLEAEKYLLSKYQNISWIFRLAPVYSPKFKLNIDRRTKIKNFYYRVGKGNAKLSVCNIKNISICVKEVINNRVDVGIYNISDKHPISYNDLLKFQKANNIISIPRIIFMGLYIFGRVFQNIFLKENCVKLLTDNIFSSKKIQNFIKLEYDISQTAKHDN